MKTLRFVVPVEDEMHKEVNDLVEKKSYDGIAAYIRMLVRQDLEREKRIEDIT